MPLRRIHLVLSLLAICGALFAGCSSAESASSSVTAPSEVAAKVQLLQAVPVLESGEIEEIEIRPGEQRFQRVAATYAPPEKQQLVNDIVELLADTEGIPPRTLEEIGEEAPNLVVLHLSENRELRFSVLLSSPEFESFLPVTYAHDDLEERGLLANETLARLLREVYTEDGTPADIQAYLGDFRKLCERHEIPVLAVKAESLEPLAISLTVPRSLLDTPEGVFVSHKIARVAHLARWSGVPLQRLDVIGRDENEERLLDQYAVNEGRMEAAGTDPALVEKNARERVTPAAEDDRVRIDRIQVVDEGGLIVECWATSLDGDLEMVRRFAGVGGVIGAYTKDPRERPAAFRLYLDGPDGQPLIRRYEDFELGRVGEWSAPGYGPPG